MKHLPRPCAGCREPTSSYREDCRTCQARRRAIQTHDSPYLMQGRSICPRCWRTAGLSLPASSVRPENYGQPLVIENQWNPIYSICRACIHAPEGTVPLDSPRVYLPVNPRARRTSKQRIYPSRANPVLFLPLSHCTRCEKPIDADSRHAGHPLCRKHYRQLKRQNEHQDTGVNPIGKKSDQDELVVHDAGLASFLHARRKRLSHASTSLPRSRSRANPCMTNTMVHTPSAL